MADEPAATAPKNRLPVVQRKPALPAESTVGFRATPVETTVEAANPSAARELPGLGDFSKAMVASTLEEAKRAVVKIEVPIAGGTAVESGSGFFVDGRGWIATNDHLIQNISSAARVRLSDGMTCEIEGIVSRLPDRDLALLKLRERPYQITMFDISRDDAPKLGEQVYAFGHPYDADFSLSKGIVGRVLNTSELSADARQLLHSTMQTPDDMTWIQHDAKISPGNSGGPLIDDQGRVLGVNSFVHSQAEFGYASDVRYLRTMVREATDDTTPLPPASNVVQEDGADDLLQNNVDVDQLNTLFAQAERFHFQPDSEQQYATLANLAAMLTAAKHLEYRPGHALADATVNVGRSADELAARLGAIDFRLAQYEAVNRFARRAEEKPGQGVFAFSTVVAQAPNALILEVGEGGKRLVVQVGPGLAAADPHSRWLVLGVYSGRVAQVRLGEGGEPQSMRVVTMYYMLRL